MKITEVIEDGGRSSIVWRFKPLTKRTRQVAKTLRTNPTEDLAESYRDYFVALRDITSKNIEQVAKTKYVKVGDMITTYGSGKREAFLVGPDKGLIKMSFPFWGLGSTDPLNYCDSCDKGFPKDKTDPEHRQMWSVSSKKLQGHFCDDCYGAISGNTYGEPSDEAKVNAVKWRLGHRPERWKKVWQD